MTLQDGSSQPSAGTPPFEAAEFARRVVETKAVMSRRGIDSLVISDPANIFYLTGYDAWSFYTPMVLLVSLDDDAPIWLGRFMDSAWAGLSTYLPAGNVRAYPDRYVQAADIHPMDVVADYIRGRGWGAKCFGVEIDAFYYSARAHAALLAGLPDAKVVDADLLVNWIRLKKSPAELALMRQAGAIADAVIRRAIDKAAPGVRECDIAAEIYHQQMTGAGTFGGVYTSSPPLICCGIRARAPHALWTDEPLQPGSVANFETAGSRHHYHSPIARTVYLGTPAQAYRDLASTVTEGLNEALEAVRPGALCEDVEATWRTSIARRGFEKEARVGYSIGIGFPPTWGERTASLRKGDRTVLEAGMTFHLMTGLWLDETGATITQSFAVTESGYEALTSCPRELFVKP